MPDERELDLHRVATAGEATSSVTPPPPDGVVDRERQAVGLQHLGGRGRRVGRAPPRRPEAAGPDRVVGVAALELDPDVGAHGRHGNSPTPARRTGTTGIAHASARRRARPGSSPGPGPASADRRCRRPCRGTCRSMVAAAVSRRSSRLHRRDRRPAAVPGQREVLGVLAAPDPVRHPLHVVQAVVGRSPPRAARPARGR